MGVGSGTNSNKVWLLSGGRGQAVVDKYHNSSSKSKRRKRYRCQWLKVPYPVPEDCVCSCQCWELPLSSQLPYQSDQCLSDILLPYCGCCSLVAFHIILLLNFSLNHLQLSGNYRHQLCILYNQRDATYTMFFIIISALQVSGNISAHHQELIKLYVQPWLLSCFPAVQRWSAWVGIKFQSIHTSG